MKLAKLSLATLIALGAVSTASATSLEEAIKNVDLTGFARYRYTNTKKLYTVNDNRSASHGFKSVLNLQAAYSDNFYGVLGLRYHAADGSGKANDTTNVSSTFNVHQAYLGYKVGGTEIKLGKQQISSMLTDDLVGTGILATNSDIAGLTLAAFAFDALEASGENDGALWDRARTKSVKVVKPNAAGDAAEVVDADQKTNEFQLNYGNAYGAAVIGSYDPVSFQLWYGDLTKLAAVAALEVAGNFSITDDIAINAKLQYAYSKPHTEVEKLFGKTNFYATELGTELFGAELTAGYVGWKVKDGDKQTTKLGVVSFEDQGGFIDLGEQISGNVNDYTALANKGNFFFVTAAYKFADQFSVGGDFVTGSVKDDNGKKDKYNEYVARAGYDYSKKLKFSSYYSYLKAKFEDEKDSSRKIRFEAKYSF